MLREQEVSCSLNRGAFSITSRPSDTGDKTTSLLQPHEPSSRSAEAQLLLKQFAGIVAQTPRADHAL
jgi:hypothetical protein